MKQKFFFESGIKPESIHKLSECEESYLKIKIGLVIGNEISIDVHKKTIQDYKSAARKLEMESGNRIFDYRSKKYFLNSAGEFWK